MKKRIAKTLIRIIIKGRRETKPLKEIFKLVRRTFRQEIRISKDLGKILTSFK
jgi:hypothetical protein